MKLGAHLTPYVLNSRDINDTVSKVERQLNAAAGSVAELGKRTELMDRALRNVETVPDDGSAAKLLGLEEKLPDSDSEVAALAASSLSESVASIGVSRPTVAEEGRLPD